MNIFEATDYKAYVLEYIQTSPNRGWGELSRMAQHMGVHTTLLSHVLKGTKNLSAEQADALCSYMNLPHLESEYFMCLVETARAGSPGLRARIEKRMKSIRTSSLSLSNRVLKDRALTEEERARFYSSWMYGAIRQMTELKPFQTRKEIANYWNLPTREIQSVFDFLLDTGLIIEKEGKLSIGPKTTHLDAQSPYVYQHHKNWRLKAIEKHGKLTEEDLMYSSVLTISADEFMKLREEITQVIQSMIKKATQSPPQTLAVLNIDWIKL